MWITFLHVAGPAGKRHIMAVVYPTRCHQILDNPTIILLPFLMSPNTDIARTAITQSDIFDFQKIGVAATSAKIQALLSSHSAAGFWIHFDVDVLDQVVMPAVDCPGSPGLSVADMVSLLNPLVSDRRCLGMTVSIYDPEKDPDGHYAKTLVALLGQLAYREHETFGPVP